MNREDLIKRLVARKLQLAGNAQAGNAKPCFLSASPKK
jgi:hypothetical protein